MASPFALAKASFWDRAGVVLSGLCAAHCLLMPLALAALPLWPAAAGAHAWLHPVFAVLLVPVTLFALRGRRRGDRATVLLLGLGLITVLLATLAHDLLGRTSELAAMLLGSGLLVAGHLRNARRRDVRHAH